jgi:hypothetical protein
MTERDKAMNVETASTQGFMSIELDAELSLYVLDMLATGLYGSDAKEVVESLVMAGIRDAVARKFIALRSFGMEVTEDSQPQE